MLQAWDYLWSFYQRTINWFFNSWVIYARNGRSISFGWFMVSLFVFGLIIKNLLMLPKSALSSRPRAKMPKVDNKGGDDNG